MHIACLRCSPLALYRYTRLLTHWARQGWEVHVICVDPDTAAQPEWDPELTGLYPDLLHRHPVPSSEKRRMQLYAKYFSKRDRLKRLARPAFLFVESQPDPQRWWVGDARRAALKVMKTVDFDAVLSFGNPMSDHLVGLALKKCSGLPWIAHFSDPWIDNPYRSYPRLTRAINARQERSVVSHADGVIFVSSETRDLIMRKYPSEWHRRARVVPHYFDPDIYPEPGPPDLRMVFRHLGAFYQHRTPEPLFQALSLLKSREPGMLTGTLFEMVGPSYTLPPPDALLAACDLQDCAAVRPPVPYIESLKLMAEADVLILMDSPVTDPNIFLPSKLVDYLGAVRPLLGITPLRGPSADLIRKAGGLVVHPQDTEGIADAIRTYIQEYRANTLFRNRIPDGQRRSAYEVTTVAQQFEEVIERSIENR